VQPALKYWLALNRIPGLGPKRFERLEEHFGDLEQAWTAGPADLAAAGLEPEIVERILIDRRALDPDDEVEQVERAGLRAFARISPGYPRLLKEIYDPPPVLYVRGTPGALDERGITVVGTRTPTPYGREAALRLTTELASAGLIVVSGLARGIDGIAHRAALDVGATTVAVMGAGLDLIYPHEHRKLADQIAERGALMSEFPLGHKIEPANFPRRNRILSGLTRGTLVIEAGFKSGAMITATFANEQGRDVFSVPGSILSEKSAGTNSLIQQGARLVARSSDILEDLKLAGNGRQLNLYGPASPHDEIERQVLEGVTDEPVHIDDVIRSSGLPSATVSAALALMELRGLVRQAGPLHYSRSPGLARG
jgi:DNA processing protein